MASGTKYKTSQDCINSPGTKIPRYHPDSCQISGRLSFTRNERNTVFPNPVSIRVKPGYLFRNTTPVGNSIMIRTRQDFQPMIPSLWWKTIICGQMPAPSMSFIVLLFFRAFYCNIERSPVSRGNFLIIHSHTQSALSPKQLHHIHRPACRHSDSSQTLSPEGKYHCHHDPCQR